MKTNKVNMSSLVDNTTYTGEDALNFYSKILLEGETLKMFQLIPDVKSKVKIPRLDLTGILQTSDCTFTAGGAATLSQKDLEVCPIKINLEFCTRDFEVNFLASQLRAGSTEAQMPTVFQDYLLEQITKATNAELETLLWSGDTEASSPDICDGLLKQFTADAAVIDVGGAVLSAANIIAELGKVYDAIPATIANRGKVVIFVSPAAAKFYRQAIAALNNGLVGTYNVGNFALSYIDIPVVISNGMPTNDMVAAEPQNLWYGCDLTSDQEDVLVIPQRNTSGAPTIRVVADFKFGVGYGVGEEVVFYS